MCEIWNEMDVKKPPMVTISSLNTLKVQRSRHVISTYLKQCTLPETEFGQTAALLSRLMARRKNSFRRMIVFRYIQKLNSSTCKLLSIDLARDLHGFFGALPDNFEEINASVDLPTRNSLEFVLIRILSVYGIHNRIRECCLAATDFTKRTIQSNFFMDINTLFLAVFAKLHNLSGILANECVHLYTQLLQVLEDFPQQGKLKFLPADMVLPELLEKFNVKLETEESNDTPLVSIISTAKTKSNAPIVNRFNKKTDLGKEIVRQVKVKTTAAKKLDINSLQTIEAIRAFTVQEQKARQQSLQSCATKNIANHEWNGALKLFERKAQKESKERATSFFCKFLSSKV